ncbi:Cu(I)-responsive transcriptional regulator [Chitinimonas koreensis]|uniref:Cu(I)-responsive transcriptional regulator n=1 Tax=Chitinimonas koreensis TaxID=356302 RepID=UPI00042379C2|nr:Cu(I)-responsive transcriptional regulator [Chitinimonas koreensis]QNM95654.1 Cu(I)-responsive transcriptional regulator [Chitinimonas koreensis]
MNIGEVAAASGVTAKMIRHYEGIGLLPESARSAAGYRQYGERDVHLLRFIRRARDLGFSLEQIALLLSLWQDRGRASADVKRLAEAHIAELDGKIRALTGMRDTLLALADGCCGDARPDCPILDELAARE